MHQSFFTTDLWEEVELFFRYLWSEPVIVRLTAVSEMNDFEFVPDFLNS